MATKRPRKDDAAYTVASYLQMPAANGLAMSQKLALETTRFWARRIHAYADQMEELSRCSNADDFMSAQKHFLERMREDYAHETSAFADILTTARDETQRVWPAVGAEERP